MKTPRLKGICAAVIAGTFSLGCDASFNFFSNCSESPDHSWVQEGELSDVYAVKLESIRGNVTLTDACIKQLYFFEEVNQPQNSYQAVLVNKSNEPIFKERFEFPHIIVSEGFPPISFVDRTSRTIFLPAKEDAERIDIYDSNCVRILNVKVSDLERKDF